MNIPDKIANYKEFLDETFKKLSEKEMDVSEMMLDHIAYRTQTQEEFRKTRKNFKKIGNIVSENIVRGRKIPVFKLIKPLVYKH